MSDDDAAPQKEEKPKRRSWAGIPAILLTVATLSGALVSLAFQLNPNWKPDPNERLQAKLSVITVEPKVSVADYIHRIAAPADVSKDVDAWVRYQVNDPHPTEVELRCERKRQVHLHGYVAYVDVTVEGLKKRSVVLGVALYDWRTGRRVPQYDAVFQPHKLRSPTDEFVETVFVNPAPQAHRPYYLRLELRDQDQRTLLAIADSKRFRGFATPTTRQPKPCPR